MINYLKDTNLFKDSIFTNFFSSRSTTLLATDIKETDKGYELFIDVPGFNKSNIKISFVDGELTVKALRENVEDKHSLQERFVGEVSRTYYLEDANGEDIVASYNDGVLNIKIGKDSKASEEKFIKIN